MLGAAVCGLYTYWTVAVSPLPSSSYVPLPDYAAEAARFIREWQRTGVLPEPTYPETFSIEINHQVARSLNLPLPDRDEIRAEVRRLLHQSDGEATP